MILGVKNWHDPHCYYSQSNNSIENILSTYVRSKQLETCGPTACINALASMGYMVEIELIGDGRIQPEDLLTIYLNDPSHEVDLQKIRDDINPEHYMDNRVPQYLPYALEKVFAVGAVFSWGADWSDCRKIVESGRAIIVCLKEPSHYVTLKAYDTDSDEFLYDDPWPANYWPKRHKGKSGFNRRMDRSEFLNIKNFKVVVE